MLLKKVKLRHKIVHNKYNQYALIVKVILIIQSRIQIINMFLIKQRKWHTTVHTAI